MQYTTKKTVKAQYEEYRALYGRLREMGIRPARTLTDAARVGRERRLAAVSPQYSYLSHLRQTQIAMYVGEIRRRGGETAIYERDREVRLSCADRRNGMLLLHCEGWRQYSRQFGARRASLSYLCGCEEGQRWAVRVPGAITTVDAALEWLTPSAVRRAMDAGRRVERQGDLYVVESRIDAMPTKPVTYAGSHAWDPSTRTLTHDQHVQVHVDYSARVYMQRAYKMGRSGRRGAAD